MYTKNDIKFYFDKLSEMKDKVNTLEDEVKQLNFDLPHPLHDKVRTAHVHVRGVLMC